MPVKWHIAVRRIVTALSHKRLQSFVACPTLQHTPHSAHMPLSDHLAPRARPAPALTARQPRRHSAPPLPCCAPPLLHSPGPSALARPATTAGELPVTSLASSSALNRSPVQPDTIYVEDFGYTEDPVLQGVLNPPHRPFPPRSFASSTHHRSDLHLCSQRHHPAALNWAAAPNWAGSAGPRARTARCWPRR